MKEHYLQVGHSARVGVACSRAPRSSRERNCNMLIQNWIICNEAVWRRRALSNFPQYLSVDLWTRPTFKPTQVSNYFTRSNHVYHHPPSLLWLPPTPSPPFPSPSSTLPKPASPPALDIINYCTSDYAVYSLYSIMTHALVWLQPDSRTILYIVRGSSTWTSQSHTKTSQIYN